jgi:CheY-like chemotaxis protein
MAGERILLVEDNPQNRRLAQFLLKSRGYIVYEATTGEEALELARAHLPDLILMDLQLPGLDGFAATRILKENAVTTDIPVIALTAYAMKGDREKALEAGCESHPGVGQGERRRGGPWRKRRSWSSTIMSTTLALSG